MKTPNELVMIEWLDAVTYQKDTEYNKEDLGNKPSKLLEETRTYGYVYSEDNDAICVMHEHSDDDKEFSIIPTKWIKKITRYKQ